MKLYWLQSQASSTGESRASKSEKAFQLKLTETVPWVADGVDDVGDATDSWVDDVVNDGIDDVVVDWVDDVVVDPVANAANQTFVDDRLVVLERSSLARDDQEGKNDC